MQRSVFNEQWKAITPYHLSSYHLCKRQNFHNLHKQLFSDFSKPQEIRPRKKDISNKAYSIIEKGRREEKDAGTDTS